MSSLLFAAIFLAASVQSAYVSPDVTRGLQTNGSIQVLIAVQVPSTGPSAQLLPSDSPAYGLQARKAFKTRTSSSQGVQDLRWATGNWMVANITAEGLESLLSNPAVSRVLWDRPVYLQDAQSNAQIGADVARRVQINGTNVTGRGQTICVVDTGIDYRHESLGACAGFVTSDVPNQEPVSYSDADELSLYTGQMSFPTSSTDTSTVDRSYVLVQSAITDAFRLTYTVPNFYQGRFNGYYTYPLSSKSAYLVVDNSSRGNASAGIFMIRDPVSSNFVPYLDEDADVNVTFGPSLSGFSVSNDFGVRVFVLAPPLGCTLPANGTEVFFTNLTLQNLSPQETFTVPAYFAHTWGIYVYPFTANLTVPASNLDATCSGGLVRLAFDQWSGYMLPGLNAPGVHYSIRENRLPYHALLQSHDLRVFVPGITQGSEDPSGSHALWIPETSQSNASLQSALSLDLSDASTARPRFGPTSTNATAGYTADYNSTRELPDQSVSEGFITPHGSRVVQLGLNSAQLHYMGQSNSSIIQTPHPYSDNTDLRIPVTRTGFSSIRLHFPSISVENGYDYVYIESPNGTSVANYTGTQSDVWTAPIAGDTAIVHFKSDGIINGYGFTLDAVSNYTGALNQSWQCGRVLAGKDFITQSPGGLDDHYHGTHVAGIAAGNGSITGVAPDATLLSAKVFDATGSTTTSTIIAGVDWCAANAAAYNVSVITMSLGTSNTYTNTCDDDPMAQSIARAVQQGIFVSVASGNSYDPNGISSPACASTAFPIGAVDSTDTVASFSNAWTGPLVLAPGVSVLSSIPGNLTERLSGTSMATPHVAGFAALLQQAAVQGNGSRLSVPQLKDLMTRSGRTIRDARSGRDYPRIDVAAAVTVLTSSFTPRNLTLRSFSNATVSPDDFAFINVSFIDDTPAASCSLTWFNGTETNFTMAALPGACTFNVTGQSDSNATGIVTVIDPYGNQGMLSFTRAFNLRPRAVQLSLANGTINADAIIHLNATFLDADARTCLLQDGNSNYSAIANASACTFELNLSEGPHVLRLFVIDSYNQSGSSPATSVLIDRIPPTPPVMSYPINQSATSSNLLTFTATFTDANPSNCTFTLDSIALAANLTGSTNATCSARAGPLADGWHSVTVNATDSANHSSISANYSFLVKTTLPAGLSFVTPSPANGSFQNDSSVTFNISWSDEFPSACWIVLDNVTLFPMRLAALNARSCIVSASLADGWHDATAYANDSAGNTNTSAALTFAVDTQAPLAPQLSVQNNASGFAQLNWTASDNVALDALELYRNATLIARLTASTSNYSDRNAPRGQYYSYALKAYDRAGHANDSTNATLFVNDTLPPRPITNLTASNLPDGSVNVSWTASLLDDAGEPESAVTYYVYRSANTSNPILTSAVSFGLASISTNATLLGNTTQAYWIDASVLQSNASYSYAILATDANQNVNTTLPANGSINQTTATSCTATFSAFSACSNGQQSRTRTCFGTVQTETQSCFSGGGSSSGGSSNSGGSSSSTSTPTASTTTTSSGPRGGGGAAGGSQSFLIESLPGVLDFSRGRPASTKFTVSSYYTGYLRYLNFTLAGIPRDWYDVLGPTVVTPVSKTDFWISWHIPQDAQGRYPVTLELSGVGTKNAGLLKTNYSFELVLSTAPAQTQYAASGSTTGTNPVFVPLQSDAASSSSGSPFTGRVSAASLEVPDSIFLLLLLLMALGGFIWVNNSSARRPWSE